MSVNDVTEVVASCQSQGAYRLCFSSRYLTVAIPEKPPRKGGSWTVDGDKFTVIDTVPQLLILGRNLDDVYALEAKRISPEPPAGSGTHTFRIFFSYERGLIAFGEIEKAGEPDLYFATRFPSIGAEGDSR